MRFNQIKRETNRVLQKISGYLDVLSRNKVLDEEYAPDLYQKIADAFGARVFPVSQSLLHIGLFSTDEKYKLDKVEELKRTIWRMAANKALLRCDCCVPYRPKFIKEEEEIEVRFIECKSSKNNRLDVTARVLTGHCAGNIIKFNFSEGSVQRILRNIGYNNRQYVMPTVYNSLNGLYAKLDVVLENEQLRLKDVVEDSSITTFNRKNILTYRCGNTTCPRCVGAICSECTATRHECMATYNQTED